MTRIDVSNAPAPLRIYTWRPARTEDAEAILDLLIASDEFDGTQAAGTLESVQRELEDTWLGDQKANSLVALSLGGDLVGFAMIFANPEPLEQRRAHLWIETHPEHRGDGLRPYLIDWAVPQARVVLEAMDFDFPGVIHIGCEDKMKDRIDLFHSRGFSPVRYFYRMRRDLRKPLPDRALPAGLTLRIYTPDLSQSLREAFNEAFQDHWNFEAVNEEDWDIWFTGREDFRPDLTYLAMAGEEIAGFSINGVNPEKNQRYGLSEGWVHQLGTLPPWRRRGIASALLCVSMQGFKRAGLNHATLGVDTQNPTGALGLYEGLGFEAVKRFVLFEKEV